MHKWLLVSVIGFTLASSAAYGGEGARDQRGIGRVDQPGKVSVTPTSPRPPVRDHRAGRPQDPSTAQGGVVVKPKPFDVAKNCTSGRWQGAGPKGCDPAFQPPRCPAGYVNSSSGSGCVRQ
jgi:hypothetical protein